MGASDQRRKLGSPYYAESNHTYWGTFETLEEALSARLSAEALLGIDKIKDKNDE